MDVRVKDDDSGIWIESTRALKDQPAACLMRWDGVERYVPNEDVRQTAEDLMTCAAYADLIEQLLQIGLEPDYLGPLMTDIVSKRQPKYFGTPRSLFLLPGGSSERKKGVVMLGHRNLFHQGKSDGYVFPDKARSMARQWMTAAEAAESDTLFDKVLRRAGWLGDGELQAVFELLYDIRLGKDTLDTPT